MLKLAQQTLRFTSTVLTQKTSYPPLQSLQLTVPSHQFRYQFTPQEMETANPLVQKALSLDNATLNEIKQSRITQAIQKYQKHGADSGSAAVQLAIISEKILGLYIHLQTTGRKDVSAKLKLREYIGSRQKIMKYLRRKDYHMYKYVLKDLGIPDFEIYHHHKEHWNPSLKRRPEPVLDERQKIRQKMLDLNKKFSKW